MEPTIRVLVITDMYYRPGARISATFVHRQLLELRSMGVDARVLQPVPLFFGPLQAMWSRDGGQLGNEVVVLDRVPIHRIAYRKLLPVAVAPRLAAVTLARSLVREALRLRPNFRFDLVHAHYLFPAGWAALEVARATGAPLVCTARGSDVHTNPYRNRGIMRLTRQVIRESDRVLAVSDALGRRVAALAPPREPVRTVYNGVDTSHFRPMGDSGALRRELGLPSQGVGFCAVTRLAAVKGLFDLLEAFARVRRHRPEAWLAVVGSGPLAERLRSAVRRLDLESAVFLPGARCHEEIPRWLNAADVFVLTSYNEGLPNVLLEAMACGLPAVATDVGGVTEATGGEEAAILVVPGDVASVAAALSRLAGDPELRQRLGGRARERARRRFAWRRSAAALFKAYEELVPAAGTPHPRADRAIRGG